MGELEGSAGKGNWLRGDMSEVELVKELLIAEFTAYCCTERKNKEATVVGKMVALNVYHEQWVRLSLPLQHFRIQAVRMGIKSCLLYTSPSPRDKRQSRMPSSA